MGDAKLLSGLKGCVEPSCFVTGLYGGMVLTDEQATRNSQKLLVGQLFKFPPYLVRPQGQWDKIRPLTNGLSRDAGVAVGGTVAVRSGRARSMSRSCFARTSCGVSWRRRPATPC